MKKSTRVALLAEGVDRNFEVGGLEYNADVALLAEGVDRNCFVQTHPITPPVSPSSRRAWIEMVIDDSEDLPF